MANSDYQIIVRNMSAGTQYFYVFQKQAQFQPTVASTDILSSSLGCQSVANYENSGAQIIFGLGAQIYAGAVSTMAPLPPSLEVASFSLTNSLMLVSETMAAQPIALTTANGSPSNTTNLTINPLALSKPNYQDATPIGNFTIKIPIYTPASPPQLYCGVASINSDQTIILSSFIAPTPNTPSNCAPKQIFFVKIGYLPAGSRVTYSESNAASCDFTSGATTISVTYNANGTFTIQG